MDIGSAKAERVDSNVTTSPSSFLRYHRKSSVREARHIGVWSGEMQIGRNDSLLHGNENLRYSSEA